MKRYNFYLKAKEPQSYGIVGNYFHVFSALGDLTIRTNNGDSIVLPQAVGYKTPEIFETITIISDVDQTVQFYAGFGQINDGRTIVLETLDTNGGATVNWAQYVLIQGDHILIAPKNMSRLGLSIQNRGSNVLIIGDINGNGFQIQPGNICEINQGCKAEWYLSNFSNALVKAYVMEFLP